MKNIFDYEKNILKFTTKDNFTIDFKLRGKVTIITGETATGKSWIVDCIKNYKNATSEATPYNCENVLIIDTIQNCTIPVISKNCLIIIDRGDFLLNSKLVKFINNDRFNHYLIIARGNTGVNATPNHYAELKRENMKFYLEYLFNEDGWC